MSLIQECFVIAPIDALNTDTRRRTDQLINHIIKPAVGDAYEVTVAHHIDQPGRITVQVIDKIVSSPLLIADLTDGNPNVFYELSIRHVLDEPAILLVQEDQLEEVPFDLHDMRLTHYDLTDPDKVEETIKALEKQIATVAQPTESTTNAVADQMSVVQHPQGPEQNRTLLGTLLIANRIRYELIKPFFDTTLYRDLDARLATLQTALQSILRESARREWMSREKILSAFNQQELREEIEALFQDVEQIIPALTSAMASGNEEDIKKCLRRWEANNTRYMIAWSKQYDQWIEIEHS